MNEFEIRIFGEEDEPDVASLWDLTFPGDPPRDSPNKVVRRKLATQRELFLVGLLDGRIVGTVLGGYDGCRGWIYHLAVHPEHQRVGLGSQLMRDAESRLRALGCPKINLQVRVGSDAVVAFYERLGFIAEDRLSLGKALE